MKDKIKFYLDREHIIRDKNVVVLARKYLEKAQKNLLTTQILSEINRNSKVREILKIPKDYDSNEWVVITGYYAMYSSALALLAKIGFRSKSHTATLIILDELFVKKKLMDSELLLTLKNAFIKKEELEKLSDARHKREIAQYSITKDTTRDIAEKIKKDAYEFVNKVELILMQM